MFSSAGGCPHPDMNFLCAWGVSEADDYLYAMIQNAVIAVLFLGALFYVGRMLYRSFTAKTGCDSGCGKCGALDIDKIEQQLKKKGI
jgi:hypothetical protein